MDIIERLTAYKYDQYSTSINKEQFDELKKYEKSTSDTYIVYRGICIPSEESLAYIKEKIKDNKFSKRSGTQSFTLDEEVAKMFADSEMSNFPTQRIVKATELMEKRFDRIAGYGSLIIEAKFKGEDCLDVSSVIGSEESEILVKPNSKPLSLSYKIEKSYYEQIRSGELDPRGFMDDLGSYGDIINKQEKLDVIKHIISTWSEKLTEQDITACATAISTCNMSDKLKLIKALPDFISRSDEFKGFVLNITTLTEMLSTKTIDTTEFKSLLKEAEKHADYSSISEDNMTTLYEQDCLDEKKTLDCIKQLAKGNEKERERAIEIMARYSIADKNVVRALFKSELKNHYSKIDEYQEFNPNNENSEQYSGYTRNSENVFTRPQREGSNETCQVIHSEYNRSAFIRCNVYGSTHSDEKLPFGISITGSKNLYKLLSQYELLSGADKIKADIIMEDTLQACIDILSVEDPIKLSFNGESSIITKYPNHHLRRDIVEVVSGVSIQDLHSFEKRINNLGLEQHEQRVIIQKHYIDKIKKVASVLSSERKYD